MALALLQRPTATFNQPSTFNQLLSVARRCCRIHTRLLKGSLLANPHTLQNLCDVSISVKSQGHGGSGGVTEVVQDVAVTAPWCRYRALQVHALEPIDSRFLLLQAKGSYTGPSAREAGLLL